MLSKDLRFWIRFRPPPGTGLVNYPSLVAGLGPHQYGYFDDEIKDLWVGFKRLHEADSFRKDQRMIFEATLEEPPNMEDRSWRLGTLPVDFDLDAQHASTGTTAPRSWDGSMNRDTDYVQLRFETRLPAGGQSRISITALQDLLSPTYSIFPIKGTEDIVAGFTPAKSVGPEELVSLVSDAFDGLTVSVVKHQKFNSRSNARIHFSKQFGAPAHFRMNEIHQWVKDLGGDIPITKTQEGFAAEPSTIGDTFRLLHLFNNSQYVQQRWINVSLGKKSDNHIVIRISEDDDDEPIRVTVKSAAKLVKKMAKEIIDLTNSDDDEDSNTVPVGEAEVDGAVAAEEMEVDGGDDQKMAAVEEVQGVANDGPIAIEKVVKIPLADLPWGKGISTPARLDTKKRKVTLSKGVKRSSEWYDVHHAIPPEDLETIFETVPSIEGFLSVIDEIRDLSAHPAKVILALNSGQDVASTDEVVYILFVKSTRGDAVRALNKLSKHTPARMRLYEGLMKRLRNIPDEQIVYLPYIGQTVSLKNRSSLDAMQVEDEVGIEDSKAWALPFIQHAAGNARSLNDYAFVTYQNGVPYVHGAHTVISKGLPAVIRVPIARLKSLRPAVGDSAEGAFAGMTFPTMNLDLGGKKRFRINANFLTKAREIIHQGAHQALLILSDARGKRGKSLEDSRTGQIFTDMAAQLEQTEGVLWRDNLWHDEDEFPSNVEEVTEEDITRMSSSIRDDDLVILDLGTTVSEFNTNKHILDEPVLSTAFMSIQLVEIHGIPRLRMVMPHPGIMNYFGEDVDWVLESFSKAIALVLILGSIMNELRSTKKFTAHDIWTTARELPFFVQITQELEQLGSRSFWAGDVVTALSKFMKLGLTPAQALVALRLLQGRQTVTTLIPPEDRTSENAVKIHPEPKTSDIYFSFLAPPWGEHKYPQICSFWLDRRFRGDKIIEGHFMFRQQCQEVRFVKLDGNLLEAKGLNKNKKPLPYKACAVPKSKWAATVTMGSNIDLIERIVAVDGMARPTTPLEQVQIAARRSDKGLARAHLISSLDFETIKAGVLSGELMPITICSRVSLSFLDSSQPPAQAYTRLGDDNTKSWSLDKLSKEYDQEKYSFHPFFRDNFWKLAIFRRDKTTDWDLRFVGIPKSFGWASSHKNAWPVNHGQQTKLFKAHVGPTWKPLPDLPVKKKAIKRPQEDDGRDGQATKKRKTSGM